MSSAYFYSGPNTGRRYPLDGEEAVIGRRTECQICIPDMRVSRQHARIRHPKADHWMLEDLSSNNGTFLNGVPIMSPARVKNGDEVRIADHYIRLELLPDTELPRLDSTLTVVELSNPRIYQSSEADPDDTEFWRPATSAGVRPRETKQLLERKVAAMSAILNLVNHADDDPEVALTTLLDSLFDLFPDARSAGILARNDATGELEIIAHRTLHTPSPSTELEVPRSIIASLEESGRGVLLRERASPGPHVPSRAESPPPDAPEGSHMGAPIRAGDGDYGVCYVESLRGDFGQEDLDLLTNIASQVAQALHATHMQKQLAEKSRIERDLRVARQIQRSLLPAKKPSVTGLDFGIHYEPALQIGGDFYDFIWHDNTHLAIVVGDVAGKAISAALYMARLTSELRSRAAIARSPARLIAKVNEEMLKIGEDSMFATLVYCLYDLEDRSLSFVNAGHMAPLVKREGRVYALESEDASSMPVGVLPNMEVGEARVQLHAGDVVVLTTDGIHEARNPYGREYGGERLSRRIRTARGGPESIVGAVLSDIDDHVGPAQQTDDQTVVAMSIGRHRARRSTDTAADVESE